VYDFIIVGAGPAGATLARQLGKNNRVLLLDKRNFNSPSDFGKRNGLEKCCGGLVAPDAQKMLAKMGLGVPRQVLVGPQLFTVRTIDVQNQLEQHYQRHYINIDREKFDAWLVSLVPPRVDVRWTATFRKFEQKATGIQISYTWQGKEYNAETKYLVGADGAASSVRKILKPEIEPRKYFAIQEWFKIEKNTAYYSAIFDREITDFYAWTIPKEEYLLVGAALIPDNHTSQRFEQLKDKLGTFGFELGEKVKRQGAYILRPSSTNQIYLGRGNVILIGEAAGWISPTSAEGLSYAFRSALAVANSVKHYQEDFTQILNGYHKNSKDLRRNILLKNAKAPFMFHQGLRKLALRSGVMRIRIED